MTVGTGVARGGQLGSCPGWHFLGSFVRNVLLQIRFKCLDFAQKCYQSAINYFEGRHAPDPLSWTRLTAALSYEACDRTHTPKINRTPKIFQPSLTFDPSFSVAVVLFRIYLLKYLQSVNIIFVYVNVSLANVVMGVYGPLAAIMRLNK